ncbi:hypothetical protein RvY_01691-2 [Ramazzottius varieornatus]|uniref:EGF-like domain-containing protein n=1 Tax=Ramazzottius varieornatus TaxID=947166 RepID=A0A1D1UH90_RAMVA|nr:hypothetical protein RvY_01691-2 [Ramazzottius varieornatus]
MRCAKGKPSWIICLFFALGGTTLRQLDIYSELQQLHLPLDGISVANTASVAKSNLTAYFPGGAITKYDAPNRQGSTKALAFQKDHHGYLEGAYPWLYDLEKSPTGITILLYFKVSVSPRGSVYLLAVGNREIDPSNAAGWDIHVNSATRKVEVRFGYRTYDFRCECGNINVNRWYSVHASCRNYFGFLQYSVAVNGVPCGQEQEDKCRVVEKTPNYDPIGIDRMYIATLTPATENNAEITLDEIRIYNTWIEINSPSLPTNETITPTDEFSDVDAEAITEAQADDHYIMDSALEGDPDICCIGTGNVTGCKAFCKDPHKSKLVQQINQEFAIMHTCAAKDFCSLQPCSDSCIQDPSGYSCQCRPGYFLDADNSSCVNHCDGVFCQINTKCVPTNIPPKYFKCVCDAGHTGDFCEIEKSMCLPNPCLHGSCVSGGLNGFTCICQPDYIGDLCEEEVLDCSRYPCRHEGTCVAEDSEKGFRCECKDGYNGDVCEKASDACTFVQCSNGGRCQIVNGSPMCVCATDFNDTKCEMSNTPCQPNPCNHGGTCEQDGRQFSCICPPGFKKGGRCEEDIDECLRDKLANTTTCAGNATCENTIGSFICQCPAGYALPDCLTPIDLCSSSPCLNGATCNPVPLSYTCTCAPGYVGQHCDIKGADRCTVTASEVRIIAGRYVTYVLQCASLGDKARFYFNMGDRFYFDATEPVYTPAASDAIRARTRIEVTLQTPSERYLYYYKHWFNGPGDYALTVQVYNGEFPTAKYITVVHVDPYPDICFPTVSIINGK